MTSQVKRIESINKMAVFDEFSWDSSVKNNCGGIAEFKGINIFYGRNYSGKTTLSRIFRAMETGELTGKFENNSFVVSFGNQIKVTQESLANYRGTIRVFNEDFVRENLRFINDPEESIEAFAILGEDNNKLNREVERLEAEIGSDDDEKFTGLFAELRDSMQKLERANRDYEIAQKKLKDQLSRKATDSEIGIKYQSDLFGDQNYNITKLRADIERVIGASYVQPNCDEISQSKNLIQAETLDSISPLNIPSFRFLSLVARTEAKVDQQISNSEKIEELVENSLLNHWVEKGIALHENNRDRCGFCNNIISKNRWKELEKHFDEESVKFAEEIEDLIEAINEERKAVEFFRERIPSKERFYSIFHEQIDSLGHNLKDSTRSYLDSLDKLTEQLIKRKNNLFDRLSFQNPDDVSENLLAVCEKYEYVRTQNNEYTNSLGRGRTEAQETLRLNEVERFLIEIGYEDQISSIEELRVNLEEVKQIHEDIDNKIKTKKALIERKKSELNDESKGATKVNEYLETYFENRFLTLQSIQDDVDGESPEYSRFEVIRNGKKAYNLSEGECRLIAFCYFIAKLADTITKDSKPIIWIDDPVSSLDSNHIFFVYSLIEAQIVNGDDFSQLFVSTHNLEFLKYLKWLNNTRGKYNKGYFVVVRQNGTSTLSLMPEYLKNFVTEFNYLFDQIYKCSKIEIVDDTNHSTYFNFANNARKFLEVYLYYKYPDKGRCMETLRAFFGEDLSATLVNRVINEYSHSTGTLERRTTPMEPSEAKQIAIQILKTLRQRDHDQYKALLNSIGVGQNSV